MEVLIRKQRHLFNFGTHTLLPEGAFRVLWKILKCTKCAFRILYHRSTVRQMRKGNRTSEFHCLTRAINTILCGLKMNKQGNLFVNATHHKSESSELGYLYSTTVLHATFHLQTSIVCTQHGRDIFEVFYSRCVKPTHEFYLSQQSLACVVSPGYSQFYGSDDESGSDTESNNQLFFCQDSPVTKVTSTNLKMKFPRSCLSPLILCLNKSKISEEVDVDTENERKRLEEANSRWKSFCLMEPLGKTQNGHREKQLTVHFPNENVITEVYHLIKYSTACRLERRDRKWEIEANHRCYDRFRSGLMDSCSSEDDSDNEPIL